MFERYNFQQISSGLIIPALVLLIGFILYFAVFPSYQEVQSKQTDLQSEQQKLAEVRGSLSGVKQLVAELERRRDELEAAGRAIPDAPEIPEFLGNIDFLADQSGITIISAQVAPAETLETARPGAGVTEFARLQQLLGSTHDLGIMETELVMTGTYQNLKTFLLNVEQNLRLIDAQSVVINRSGQDEELREFTLTIHTYYQK